MRHKCQGSLGGQFDQNSSSLGGSYAASTGARFHYRPKDRSLRILVLDAKLETLVFIEKMLQDSGFATITSRSPVEATRLVRTYFFDVFIMIDRSPQFQSKDTLSVLATSRSYLSCFCWSASRIREQCANFIEETAKWPVRTPARDHDD